MSNLPAVFSFDAFPVRTIDVNGEIWFVAADVCAALGFANPRQALTTHVDPDDVQLVDTIDSLGRTQAANAINEPGMYALIFGSTKLEAKRFKRWVFEEVLPTIRKTGSFGTSPTPIPASDIRALEFFSSLHLKCLSYGMQPKPAHDYALTMMKQGQRKIEKLAKAELTLQASEAKRVLKLQAKLEAHLEAKREDTLEIIR